jgi:polysaccharide pyruvyl transferase WcaK-like protein
MIAAKLKKYSRFFMDYAKPCGPRLAYIGGVYGSRNLGDEALRDAAIKLFNKCSLLEFPRKKQLARLAKAIPIRNALLAGGTLINQKEEWLDLVSNYISSIPNFIVFGTGVADPYFWPDKRKEWAGLLNRCSFVGVRGPLSARLLSDVNVGNVEMVGDPTLIFASDTWNHRNIHMPNSIGLNIGWDWAKQWGTQENIYNEAINLASLARSEGWLIKWFVLCPADVDITNEIAIRSGTDCNIYCIYNDPIKYIDIIRSCSVFVGTRLHSVVLATCAYVPSFSIEYRPKCRDYMLSIQQENFVVRADKFKARNLWEKALNVNDNQYHFSKALYNSIKPLRETQIRMACELQNLIR